VSSGQSVFVASYFHSQNFTPGTPVPPAFTRGRNTPSHRRSCRDKIFSAVRWINVPNRGSGPLSSTLISVSEPLFSHRVSRNTSRQPNLSVTAVHGLLLRSSLPFILLCSGLDGRLHLICGFRFLGVPERGDFPPSPTVDVSKQHSIPFYEALTHATRYMRLLNRHQNPSYAYVSLQVDRRPYIIFISR